MGRESGIAPRPTVQVTFLPQNVTVTARSGDTLLDVALDNAIPLPHECGGNCACTTCHVLVLSGWENLSMLENVEAERLASADGLANNSRLGCQTLVQGNAVTVRIVEEVVSMTESSPTIAGNFLLN